MSDAIQIIHAKWIIPCETKNEILQDHALVMGNGVIKDILAGEEAKKKYPQATTQTFSTHALLPGFINMHTHIAMSFFRGLADDLSLMEWLNNHIWPSEKQFVSNDFVHDAALFAMGEMIRSGTTTFNDMYVFPEAIAKAAEIAQLRAHVSIHVIDFPTAWTETTDLSLQLGEKFIERYHQHPLIKPTIAPHAIYTVTEESLHKVRSFAEKYNLKINMHVQETADEVNESLAKTGKRPLRRLHDLGLVTSQLLAVHMTQIDAEDLEILSVTRPQIIHCPQSNMKLASGVCPVTEFQKLGLNVALGTDGVASNNDLNMLNEMQSATFLAKLITKNSQSLSAYEMLQMATINGAKALGIDHLTGSLKIGKAADFIAIDLNALETLPVYNPASQIVYAAARQQVTDVWVAGKQLLKQRNLTTLDETSLVASAEQWGKKICARQKSERQ